MAESQPELKFLEPGMHIRMADGIEGEVIGQTIGELSPMAVIQPVKKLTDSIEFGHREALPLDTLAEVAIEGPFGREYPFSQYVTECKAWSRVYGETMDIPYPPKLLIEVLKRTRQVGLDCFDAHYIPYGKFTPDGFVINGKLCDYPTGWQKPSESLFEQLNNQIDTDGGLHTRKKWNKDILHVYGEWVLIDRTSKPDYKTLEDSAYINDKLAPLLASAFHPSSVAPGCRTSVSHDSLNAYFFPKLENLVFPEGIPRGVSVGLPDLSEYITLGNLFYPQLAQTTMGELTADESEMGYSVTGSSEDGGFSEISGRDPSRAFYGDGFRPIIRFSESLK